MKTSSFKKPTYEEAIAKKRAADIRALERLKEKKRANVPKAVKKSVAGKIKPKKSKTKTLAQLKKMLDAVFSIYIRQKYADSNGNVACYTCGTVLHWKQLHCGHYISRQYLATRWHENNCRPQCVGDNIFGNGKPLDFEENLKRELGDEYVEKMKFSRHEILKLDRQWYETKIAYYKDKLA